MCEDAGEIGQHPTGSNVDNASVADRTSIGQRAVVHQRGTNEIREHDVVGEVAAIRECGANVVEELTPVDQEKRPYEVDECRLVAKPSLREEAARVVDNARIRRRNAPAHAEKGRRRRS